MPAPSRHAHHRGRTLLLLVLVISGLAAGLGLREPMPADEPRFVLAAQEMVSSGDWLFPHRGSELYAEKPPVFMWMQAASFLLTRNWRIAFLLPSLVGALLTLWLVGDLARRLWGRHTVAYATLGLFVCLQFALQAKRGQIDMVLVSMTTLSLWAFLRYLLERPRPSLLALGSFAAGLGTVTKGVGFLPLMVFLPWLWVRKDRSLTLAAQRPAHMLALVGGFLAGIAVWLAPMLGTVLATADPALDAYAREMLFKQTGTRYASAWHHVKPVWYYAQSMLTMWLPGFLLLPWLVPAWIRRVRHGDARLVLLLGWSILVLLFFSASPGKREVYIFPMLPVLCVAAAPFLPVLLRRPAVRAVLWSYIALLVVAALGAAAWLQWAPMDQVFARAEDRGLDLAALRQIGTGLFAFGVIAALSTLVGAFRSRNPAKPLLLVTTALWVTYGLLIQPALSPAASAQALMQRVGQRIGPDAELAMLGWREQHLLQADRPTVEFGFKRPLVEQWALARTWLEQDPDRRWLFVADAVRVPCLDPGKLVAIGASNRRTYVLVPGSALITGCEVSPEWTPAADD